MTRARLNIFIEHEHAKRLDIRLNPLIASKCRTRLIRFAFSHGLDP